MIKVIDQSQPLPQILGLRFRTKPQHNLSNWNYPTYESPYETKGESLRFNHQWSWLLAVIVILGFQHQTAASSSRQHLLVLTARVQALGAGTLSSTVTSVQIPRP
jgi:hypothetical protein